MGNGKREVVLAGYDPRWPGMYEEERVLILRATGDRLIAIEHIGSTAIAGLSAKPIIDILAGVRRLSDADTGIEALRGIGYGYVPEYEAQLPERRYFRKGPEGARTHHLHIVEYGERLWRELLLFRDYLRAHPETATQYRDLKQGLVKRLGHDKRAYTEAKTTFVEGVLAEARVHLGTESSLRSRVETRSAGENR